MSLGILDILLPMLVISPIAPFLTDPKKLYAELPELVISFNAPCFTDPRKLYAE